MTDVDSVPKESSVDAPEPATAAPGQAADAEALMSKAVPLGFSTKKPSAEICTSSRANGTAVGQQHLKSILSFCNSPMMNAIKAYIQFTPNLISDDGKVSVEATETFLCNYMSEFSNFIGRVLNVYPRAS